MMLLSFLLCTSWDVEHPMGGGVMMVIWALVLSLMFVVACSILLNTSTAGSPVLRSFVPVCMRICCAFVIVSVCVVE